MDTTRDWSRLNYQAHRFKAWTKYNNNFNNKNNNIKYNNNNNNNNNNN